jgi:hypothetical protein
MAMKHKPPSPLDFFAHLQWIDGKTPLLDTIEPYRRELFLKALFTFQPDGTPQYNWVTSGRAKKNYKSADLILAGLYKLLIPPSVQGNDAYVLANDEAQAGDDLSLAKKLVRANPDLESELEILEKQIRRRDGRGAMQILPSRDVVGMHGKTAFFVGFDEIHGYRSWDIFEALAMDPTRPDSLTWVTSYDSIYNSPGNPLFDLKQQAARGEDERMLFSWYSGDLCTDPAFADLEPELRANPSMASWAGGRKYLDQQKRRLPSAKYRRLHLNLPGAPSGAFFDQGVVLAAIVVGRKQLPPMSPEENRSLFASPHSHGYKAFVDMSGGSGDDAVLAIAHKQDGKCVLDLLVKQNGKAPFNPMLAVRKFAAHLKAFGLASVYGDAFSGNTFVSAFEAEGIAYHSCARPKSDLYESLEPALNAGEVELLDIPELQEQLLTLIAKPSGKIDHEPNGHDDWANAAAGAVFLLRSADLQYIPMAGAFIPSRPRAFPGYEDAGNPAIGGSGFYAPNESAMMRRARSRRARLVADRLIGAGIGNFVEALRHELVNGHLRIVSTGNVGAWRGPRCSAVTITKGQR